jgi:hypothetical protein
MLLCGLFPTTTKLIMARQDDITFPSPKNQQVRTTEKHARSKPIPITQPSSGQGDENTECDARKADYSTWLMYQQIANHRTRHSYTRIAPHCSHQLGAKGIDLRFSGKHTSTPLYHDDQCYDGTPSYDETLEEAIFELEV